ncbi:MAG: TetR family transcriptional regulator C-terminal domain-containing protein, partial [Oscillospiraceae bacterium]|nr:TetR family transcriptional regulator C-terminal domain-containing protein [Oscillospiraceae bacterium]
VSKYRHFYRIYLKKNMDGSMEDGFQTIWETQLRPRFLAAGITDERRMLYYFHYVRAGMTTVLRLWLEDGCRETPEEIANILRNSIVRGK